MAILDEHNKNRQVYDTKVGLCRLPPILPWLREHDDCTPGTDGAGSLMCVATIAGNVVAFPRYCCNLGILPRFEEGQWMIQ